MDYQDEHKKDHDRILGALDVSRKVTGLDKDILLLQERIREMKEDSEKRVAQNKWFATIAFSIIMAVAGFLIQSNADIQVLKEKVMEIKSEVEKLSQFVHTHE